MLNTFKLYRFAQILCLTLIVAQFLAAMPVFSATQKIAVVVNDGAITTTDVMDRTHLIIASSGLADTPDMKKKLRQQVITLLVDEEIKLQEAKRLGLQVSDQDVQNGFAQIASQNNMSADQFKDLLLTKNIEIETMYRQVRSQVAWTKIVQSQIRPQILVTDTDVRSALGRVRSNFGKTEYRIAEIFLAIDDPKKVSEVQNLANRLFSQIKDGQAPFPKVAQQFSQSAGANNGGDLGWIEGGQIDEDLSAAVKNLQKGHISQPIRTARGFHILLLIDKRKISKDTMPSVDAMTNEIGTKRLELLARKYLLDLKANAFIEDRV